MENSFKDFIKVKKHFQLGELVTETPHPLTENLSQNSKKNLKLAIKQFKSVDELALEEFKLYLGTLQELHKNVRETILSGHKVFLCGCGATGRLSLALEFIWRQENKNEFKDSICSFMAGGDVALIKSIEKFEDYPEYGAKQLEELNFSENDLLISITEGGETPFVIGATQKALEISKKSPYFVYCNPDNILKKLVLRSREILENNRIKKINLTIGPMAISGSTRLQASTVQMLGVGLVLKNFNSDFQDIYEDFELFKEDFKNLKTDELDYFIKKEVQVYNKNEFIIYNSCKKSSISVLTDTTERSPTFSLIPFESSHENLMSLSYLVIKGENEKLNSWKTLLGRNPRTLEWSEVSGIACLNKAMEYDFSENSIQRRVEMGKQHIFDVSVEDECIKFAFHGKQVDFKTNSHFLGQQLLLKILLNTHSSLVMGRLGRYESNVMTWVRPSNYKLIDRSIRYILTLASQSGIELDYDQVCEILYSEMSKGPEGPIVMKCLKRLNCA